MWEVEVKVGGRSVWIVEWEVGKSGREEVEVY
jgi:hypothetical protein